MNSSKPWSNLKCAKYVLSRGLNLMEQQWKRRHYYDTVKASPDTWLVLYNQEIKPSVIPIFRRTCEVKCVQNRLFCSCKYFERHGIPCRHQFAVLSQFPDYEEPSHHDMSIVWWSSYNAEHVSNDMDSTTLHDSFQFLEKNDVEGPTHYADALHEAVTATYVDPKFVEHLKKPNCCNYNLDGINFNFTYSAFGIMQCSNVNQNNVVNF